MKTTDRMKKLLVELKPYMQNRKESGQCKMKERKQLDYFCRNLTNGRIFKTRNRRRESSNHILLGHLLDKNTKKR